MTVLLQPTFLIGFLFLLTACTVGPDYHRPFVSTPPYFKEENNKTAPPSSRNKQIKQENIHWQPIKPHLIQHKNWWVIFHDPTLNALEEKMHIANQTLKNAYYNYLQARDLIGQAQANLAPTMNTAIGIDRQKTSGTTNTPLANNTIQDPQNTHLNNSHKVLLQASWEPDIWGQVRRNIESHQANADAFAALYAATRLSLEAMLAQTYFALRSCDQAQTLFDRMVKKNAELLTILRNKYKSDIASQSDVMAAENILDTSKIQAMNNHLLRSQYEHAVAVLVGTPPAYFSIPPASCHFIFPELPTLLPSHLLEARPDINQAENIVAAANAQIGVALSAFFPNLNLSGTASSVASGLGHLLSVPILNWAIGAELAQTLFDGGFRGATWQASKKAYQASVAHYRQTVLNAFQEVEDDLIAYRTFSQEMLLQKQLIENVKRTLGILRNQYQAGIVEFSNVLNAQITVLSSEEIELNLMLSKMNTTIALIKAVGGTF